MEPVQTNAVEESHRIRPFGGDITVRGEDQIQYNAIKARPAGDEDVET